MNGIDIYSGQGNIDFTQVKATGIDIVYIKATEGLSYTDATLNSYYSEAKDAGLKVGFYHYLGDNNPISEAQYFLQATEGLQVDCKYMIDVEETFNQSNDQISSNVMQFSDYLKSQNKDVGMYTYTDFYNENLNNTVKDLPLWIAEYGVDNPSVSGYVGWQYSDTGSINGVSGDVDLDSFTEGILITNSEEEKKVKKLVVVGNAVDKRAAEYLADKLQCPIIDASLPFDYSVVEDGGVIGVGGTPTTNGVPGWSGYVKTVIAGTDRYDTCQKVLDYIKTL